MSIAAELGVDAEIVLYMKDPPNAATLKAIIAKLEDPVTELVRRDSNWKKLGLTDADAEYCDARRLRRGRRNMDGIEITLRHGKLRNGFRRYRSNSEWRELRARVASRIHFGATG